MRAFVPMALFITLNIAFAEYELRGGWTPISNEEAYRRIHVHIPTVKNILRIDQPSYKREEIYSENINDAIMLVEPQKVYGKFDVKKAELSTESNSAELNEKLIDVKDIAKIETITSKIIRKAKKIDESNYNIANNNKMHAKNLDIKEKYNDDNYDDEIKDDTIERNETQTYEDTPITEETDPDPIKADTKSGYVYSIPEIKSQQVFNNFTNNFLDILDKYNINSKDKLTNYAKSRVPNIQNINKQQIVYLPLPLRFLDRYNSLNHLSVNPLMAVLLSNYGYYLPYTYGIHNNYRNLYGYLASNNIHNNKPFGNYKVFSDTDSSN